MLRVACLAILILKKGQKTHYQGFLSQSSPSREHRAVPAPGTDCLGTAFGIFSTNMETSGRKLSPVPFYKEYHKSRMGIAGTLNDYLKDNVATLNFR